MNRYSIIHCHRVVQVFLTSILIVLFLPVLAHETEEKTAQPGFRPDSEHAAAFLDALDTATIAVYPSIVRREHRTAHSFASQEQIIAAINDKALAVAIAESHRIDLGKLLPISQWELFLSSMRRIAASLEDRPSDADYRLFMEFILPAERQVIFGIHCYVLDRQGRNAFSFLLNSHHQLFVDGKLFAKNKSQAARTQLIEDATRIGMTAFEAQLEQARGRATNAAGSDTPACNANYAINELPMYGHLQKSAVRLGWNFFYDGNCSTAMKRFNRAWLLDPDNQLALWGFAVISLDRGLFEEAVRYFELATKATDLGGPGSLRISGRAPFLGGEIHDAHVSASRTVRTAASSVSSISCLLRKPLAPAAIARSAQREPSCRLRTSTGSSECCEWMSATNARPSPMPSRSDSPVITRSALVMVMASSAALGLSVSAETSRSGSLLISSAKPRRTSGWLSTMTTRRFTVFFTRTTLSPGVRQQ